MKKYYKIYYVSSSRGFVYLKDCDYNEYERLFYKLDWLWYRVWLFWCYVFILKINK